MVASTHSKHEFVLVIFQPVKSLILSDDIIELLDESLQFVLILFTVVELIEHSFCTYHKCALPHRDKHFLPVSQGLPVEILGPQVLQPPPLAESGERFPCNPVFIKMSEKVVIDFLGLVYRELFYHLEQLIATQEFLLVVVERLDLGQKFDDTRCKTIAQHIISTENIETGEFVESLDKLRVIEFCIRVALTECEIDPAQIGFRPFIIRGLFPFFKCHCKGFVQKPHHAQFLDHFSWHSFLVLLQIVGRQAIYKVFSVASDTL